MPLQHELEGVMEKNVNVVIHVTPTSQKNPTPLVEVPCRKEKIKINEKERFVLMEIIHSFNGKTSQIHITK